MMTARLQRVGVVCGVVIGALVLLALMLVPGQTSGQGLPPTPAANALGWRTYTIAAPQWHYDPARWVSLSDSVLSTSTTNAQLTLTFLGTGASLHYATGADGGTFSVRVDDLTPETFDAYSAGQASGDAIWSRVVDYGIHTLTVTHHSGTLRLKSVAIQGDLLEAQPVVALSPITPEPPPVATHPPTSTNAGPIPTEWTTYQDTDQRLAYGGGPWQTFTVTAANGGTLTGTADTGASLSAYFEGTGIRIVYSRGPEGRDFTGRIQGEHHEWVTYGNSYAPSYRYGHIAALYGLPFGPHTLTITNGPGAIWIEAIQVQGKLLAFESSTINTTILSPQFDSSPLPQAHFALSECIPEDSFYLSEANQASSLFFGSLDYSEDWFIFHSYDWPDLDADSNPVIGACIDILLEKEGQGFDVTESASPVDEWPAPWISFWNDTSNPVSAPGSYLTCISDGYHKPDGTWVSSAQICAQACPDATRVLGIGEWPKTQNGDYVATWRIHNAPYTEGVAHIDMHLIYYAPPTTPTPTPAATATPTIVGVVQVAVPRNGYFSPVDARTERIQYRERPPRENQTSHMGHTFLSDEYLCLDQMYVRDRFIYRVAARTNDPQAGTTSCSDTGWEVLSTPLWITTQGIGEQAVVNAVYPASGWPADDVWPKWGEDSDLSELELTIETLRGYGVEVRAYSQDWTDIPTQYSDNSGPVSIVLGVWEQTELTELVTAVTNTASAFHTITTNPGSDDKYVFKNVMGLTQYPNDGSDILSLTFAQSSEQHGYCETFVADNLIVCWGNIIPTVPIVADNEKVYLPQHVQQVSDRPDVSQYAFVHEIGHAFDNRSGTNGKTYLREYVSRTASDPITDNRAWVMANIWDDQNRRSVWRRGERGWGNGPGTIYNPREDKFGTPIVSVTTPFQQNTEPHDPLYCTYTGPSSSRDVPGSCLLTRQKEVTADMFLNWVYSCNGQGGFENVTWKPEELEAYTTCTIAFHGCTESSIGATGSPGDARRTWINEKMNTIFRDHNW